MGPCSGPPGSMIEIYVVTALKSPLVQVKFAHANAQVVLAPGSLRMSGNGTAVGSAYTFPAPRLLCQSGSGITWQAYAWDRAGLNNGKYRVYGDQGNFGSFKVIDC